MGLFLSTLWEGFGQLVKGEEEWNLLMLGLDNAGRLKLLNFSIRGHRRQVVSQIIVKITTSLNPR